MRGSLMAGVYRITAMEPTSLAGHSGWVLSGPLGRSRVAWVGDRLKAAEWAGTRFDPPITLLVSTTKPTELTWSGRVTNGLRSLDTKVTTRQEPGKINLTGRETPGLRVTMTLKDNPSQESTFFYVKGRGLVTSETRVDGKFSVGLEYLSGP